MLIICTSDSHGQIERLKSIYSMYPNADYYIDAGDSERSESELLPFLTVKGNNDYFVQTKYRVINLDKLNIYVIHGDRILLTRDVLAQVAKKNKCNFIIHGHSHIPHYSIHNGVHILCPGSLTFPRSTVGATYALIKYENNKVEVEILKVQNDKKS